MLKKQVNPGLVCVKAFVTSYIRSFKFDDLALKSYTCFKVLGTASASMELGYCSNWSWVKWKHDSEYFMMSRNICLTSIQELDYDCFYWAFYLTMARSIFFWKYLETEGRGIIKKALRKQTAERLEVRK